jgi:2-hydroxychromene-2-carboxylate isomerase
MDFFFSYGSTYTYLSVMRIETLAAEAGITIRWRPFHLRTLTIEQNNRPFVGKPVKMKYMWRDLERRAGQHRIPFNGIPPYPVDSEGLAHRIGILASMEGWCPEYSKALYRQWFLKHIAPGDPKQTRDLLDSLGKDVESVMSRADSDDIRSRLTSETDAARNLGIFGSPTFAVDGEIFWGDDRLENALDWCKSVHQ